LATFEHALPGPLTTSVLLRHLWSVGWVGVLPTSMRASAVAFQIALLSPRDAVSVQSDMRPSENLRKEKGKPIFVVRNLTAHAKLIGFDRPCKR